MRVPITTVMLFHYRSLYCKDYSAKICVDILSVKSTVCKEIKETQKRDYCNRLSVGCMKPLNTAAIQILKRGKRLNDFNHHCCSETLPVVLMYCIQELALNLCRKWPILNCYEYVKSELCIMAESGVFYLLDNSDVYTLLHVLHCIAKFPLIMH